jgi:hypothetical protein
MFSLHGGGSMGMLNEAPYPYIDCPVHGRQLAVVVCQHIAEENAGVEYVEWPTAEAAGVAICERCLPELVSAEAVVGTGSKMCEMELREKVES